MQKIFLLFFSFLFILPFFNKVNADAIICPDVNASVNKELNQTIVILDTKRNVPGLTATGQYWDANGLMKGPENLQASPVDESTGKSTFTIGKILPPGDYYYNLRAGPPDSPACSTVLYPDGKYVGAKFIVPDVKQGGRQEQIKGSARIGPNPPLANIPLTLLVEDLEKEVNYLIIIYKAVLGREKNLLNNRPLCAKSDQNGRFKIDIGTISSDSWYVEVMKKKDQNSTSCEEKDGESEILAQTSFSISSSQNITPTVPHPTPPCAPGELEEIGKNKDNKILYKCKFINTALGNIPTSFEGFVSALFGILLSVSGGIALILIIISGYRIMASQGNPEKLKEAKESLTSAIIGLLFIIFSSFILKVIGVDILQLPGFVP